MKNIVLASGSPRRKEILNAHGITPTIIKPEADETVPSGFSGSLDVNQIVMFFSLKKALAVKSVLSNEELKDIDYIIAADTVVYDDKIIGKPENLSESFEILKGLRNKMHQVITGVCIIDIKKKNSEIFYDISKVYFKNYSNDDIKKYISEDSTLDKAGAYAIQSSWGEQVEKVIGDTENVIGLPWYRIKKIIEA